MTNPFESTFEQFGRPGNPLNEQIYQAEFTHLTQWLRSESGHLISLRAPRAGYGKSMLLTRLQESLKNEFVFVGIRLVEGKKLDPRIVLDDLLARLSVKLPAGAGLTKLDIITRRLFALALSPLVYSGEVPCQDREGAFLSLRDRPVEAFDFHHEGAAIAQWCKQQFELLGPRLSGELSRQASLPLREVQFWVERLYAYATESPAKGSRQACLTNDIYRGEGHLSESANSLEALTALLSLISLVEKPVLVLDEVEGLSSDQDAALRTASFLTSLWEASNKLHVILSINDDVWESAFAPCLPQGLQDRFEDYELKLTELSAEEAKALILTRAPGGVGEEIWEKVSAEKKDSYYARGVLKAARAQWKAAHESASASPAPGANPSAPMNAPAPTPPVTPSTEIPAPNQAAPPTPPAPSTQDAAYQPGPQVNYPPYQQSAPAHNPFQQAAAPSSPEVHTPPQPNPSQAVESGAEPRTQAANPFSAFSQPAESAPSQAQNPSPFQKSADESGSGDANVDDLLRQFRERNQED